MMRIAFRVVMLTLLAQSLCFIAGRVWLGGQVEKIKTGGKMEPAPWYERWNEWITGNGKSRDQQNAERFAREAEASGAIGLFIMHKPTSACPEGWRETPGVFTEKDGSEQPACILSRGDSYGEVTVDAIYPGESVVLPVPLSPMILPTREGRT